MELFVSVALGPLSSSSSSVDVRLDVDAMNTVAEVAEALADAFVIAVHGTVRRAHLLTRNGVALDPAALVADIGLVHGDQLALGDQVAIGDDAMGNATSVGHPTVNDRMVALDITSGPDAGRFVMVGPGRYPIGSDDRAAIGLSDSTIERHHATLLVSRAGVANIEQVGGLVSVNAVPVNGSVIVGPTDVVRVGSTMFSVRAADDAIAQIPDALGQVAFHRTPYRPTSVTPRVIAPLDDIPTHDHKRRFSVAALLAPLVSGVGLAIMSGRKQFLILTLLAPIVAVYQWFDERRHGGRSFHRKSDEFVALVDQRCAAVDDALAAEQTERRAQAPDLAELHRRAHLRSRRLWERDATAADLLHLRLGLGAVRSRVEVTVGTRGDEALRRDAAERLAHHAHVVDVPITIDLPSLGAVGVWGPDTTVVEGLAAAFAQQVVALHSPEDVVVVVAMHPDRLDAFDWLKWAPHTRSSTSPVSGNHLVTTRAEAERLVSRLLDATNDRATNDRGGNGPFVVVMIDERLGLNAALLSQLLDRTDSSRLAVIAIGDSEARVPRQCRAVIACRPDATGRLWFTDPSRRPAEVALELATPLGARRLGMAIAPVRDASTSSTTTSLPRVVGLFDVLGVASIDASTVRSLWQCADGEHLAAPIGCSASGAFLADLVNQGPHALIAGTSGSGKSELLQTLVTSLALHYPPERLTFLFVDYKGGASSADFADLPHTVGSVTNLGAGLARRALVSLQAELNRRMQLLEGRAKDLAEFTRVAPTEAPPRLVIVVDEFATLVKEVPEFVAGIVDVAQRGRSLGIHLVLATQRPTGSVNDNILANTNLRIGLRMLDASDSMSVLGVGDASSIPVPLRGRALARTGGRELTAFQTAWAGAPPPSLVAARRQVRVTPFEFGGDAADKTDAGLAAAPASSATQLSAAVAMIIAAHADDARPRRPWLEPLPAVLTLAELSARVVPGEATRRDPGRTVVFGIVDRPSTQTQDAALVDFDADGGLIVLGTGGSGRTTVLRTIAASLAMQGSPSEVTIIGLDGSGRGLRSIDALPHVAAVAAADDPELMTRLIASLVDELDKRRRYLAEHGADSITALRDSMGATDFGALARVVVLIDGYANLAAAFDAPEMFGWMTNLQRVIVEGRPLGIHVVMTADRRIAIPGQVASAIGARLTLRMADPDALIDAGVAPAVARSLELEAGRGVLGREDLVQVAIVGADPAVAFRSLAASMPTGDRCAVASVPLPSVCRVPASVVPWRVPLGFLDPSGALFELDLSGTDLTVAGGAGSGRSTALVLVASALVCSGVPVVGIGLPGGRSALIDAPGLAAGAFSPDEWATLAAQLDSLVAARGPAIALVVDDADRIDEPVLAAAIDRAMRAGTVRVIASVDTRVVAGGYQAGWLGELRRSRAMVLLQPPSAADVAAIIGRKPVLRPGLAFPPGRGVVATDRQLAVVQLAVALEE
jgi:DNA segregation ATPase FtsK/SpoIIIE, S-DNA-T family